MACGTFAGGRGRSLVPIRPLPSATLDFQQRKILYIGRRFRRSLTEYALFCFFFGIGLRAESHPLAKLGHTLFIWPALLSTTKRGV